MKMKMKFYYLSLSALFIFLQSCDNEEQEQIETNVVEEIIEEEVDPFYAGINENSTLDDYWDLFVKDAIRSGKPDPGFGRTINLFFGSEPDFASGVTADHAGRAYDICNDETVSFEIIESFWEDFSIVQRLYTFYHEAGHARYKYRHPYEASEVTSRPEEYPIMWLSMAAENSTFEEFVKDKNNFFKRNWENVRYFNCSED